jgi:hypothetical protein
MKTVFGTPFRLVCIGKIDPERRFGPFLHRNTFAFEHGRPKITLSISDRLGD